MERDPLQAHRCPSRVGVRSGTISTSGWTDPRITSSIWPSASGPTWSSPGATRPSGPTRCPRALLHESRMSILVVPNPVRAGRFGGFPRVQRILAATDLTGFGNQAVRAAAALALATEGELRLLHVAETQVPTWDEEASTVAKLRQLLPERWPLPVSTEVVFGRDPATTIAAAGERIDADTICVASHARGGLARVALGSVTEDLLRRTHRPVLVVRPVQE